jgi:hypothetical protein
MHSQRSCRSSVSPSLPTTSPSQLANLRAVDVVVVDPALVAGVVGRVDVDALHLPGVARQQRLERVQVVALHDQVAAVAVAAGQFRHRLQQTEGHVLVVLDDGFLADPVQCRHSHLLALGAAPAFGSAYPLLEFLLGAQHGPPEAVQTSRIVLRCTVPVLQSRDDFLFSLTYLPRAQTTSASMNFQCPLNKLILMVRNT